jgi:GTPase SAR1 family protein
MLVFSVAEESTFRAAVRLREQICRATDEAHPPIILVGNKRDIPVGERQVPAARAEALAASWHFSRYMETSAKTNEGVEEAYLALLDLVDHKQAARAAAAAAATKNTASSRKESRRLRCIVQ